MGSPVWPSKTVPESINRWPGSFAGAKERVGMSASRGDGSSLLGMLLQPAVKTTNNKPNIVKSKVFNPFIESNCPNWV
jgi:hypothetical protein